MSKKIALEIFDEIKKKNERTDIDSIPHSDDFVHNMSISIGIDPIFVKQLLHVLIDAHKIFAIEIIGEDKKNNIPRVEGYVESDLKTLRNLKYYFQDALMRLYEAEHYKRLNFKQIIKDIMPIMNRLNNTPMGQIANKAIMMGELERLLEKNFEEYTEEWKERNLDIALNKAISGGKIASIDKDDNYSEVISLDGEFAEHGGPADHKNYSDIISKSKNYPLDRILKIYGVDFFFKAQVRRHQFAYLSGLVDAGKFSKNSDLLHLKEMLRALKKKSGSDSELLKLRDDITGLERVITHRLYFGTYNR